MAEKINIISCTIAQDKGEYKTYQIIDDKGHKYGSTQEFETGEQEVEIVINGIYKNLKKIKPQGYAKAFPQKDYKFEKRKLSLEIAKDILVSSNNANISISMLTEFAEKIEIWLNR